jgi:nicotinamide-nucleotide amidase
MNEDDLAALVLAELRARGARLAVAESCTGGLIAARLTEVPGSADVFTGGVVTYANEAKIHRLGIDPDELARAGAVSDEVARAMVQGVVDRFDANAGIAVTGIAGPTGGSDEKPVGTVYLACTWDGTIECVKRHIPGTRHEVRRRTVQAALDLLRRML